MAHISLVAHALQLADSDVVAFVGLATGVGEIGNGNENDRGGDDDLDRAFTGLVWHSVLFLVYVGGHDLGIRVSLFRPLCVSAASEMF